MTLGFYAFELNPEGLSYRMIVGLVLQLLFALGTVLVILV